MLYMFFDGRLSQAVADCDAMDESSLYGRYERITLDHRQRWSLRFGPIVCGVPTSCHSVRVFSAATDYILDKTVIYDRWSPHVGQATL